MSDNELSAKYEAIRNEYKNEASLHQQDAANPNISVWVEASAGTGKTKVLSDRVLRLLLEQVNPTRILCLTYTKAAAVEMKTRISKRLSEWSVQDDEKLTDNIKTLLGKDASDYKKLNEYISRARTLFAILLDTPGGVKIQTIHSFCEEILKRFPLEAKVSPFFEILDDRESSEILKEIQNEILRESNLSSSSESIAIQYLTANLSEQNFAKVMTHITENRAKINNSLIKYGSLENLLGELQNKIGISAKDSEEKLKSECMQNINRNELKANIEALKCGGKLNKEKAAILEEIYNKNCVAEYYDRYVRCFLKDDDCIYTDSRLADQSAIKKDAEVLSRMKDEATRLQKIREKCRQVRMYNSTAAFLTIAQYINSKYEEYKQAKSCLDYEDLINKTCALLSDSSQASWVLYKLDGGIDHILLDEAQDTSPQQWDIIKALSEEFFAGVGANNKLRTVFAVGDRKQSIFSFQGADPQKFDMMSKYFSTRAGANFKKVDMEYSFRSTPAVLHGVNTVFANTEIAKGVISQDAPVEHMAVRAGEYGRVEVWPLYVAPKNEKITDDEKRLPPMEMVKKVSGRTQMACKIVKKIKQMMEDSKKSPNPLHYKDFMILVRHRNAFVEDFIRVCKEEHVNISGADKMVLSEQIAVQDLISLAKFLLLPNDDLSLAEVLKSPLYGLTDSDLEKLCCERKSAPLWTRLGDFEEYAEVYKNLQELFNELNFIRPYELFNYVLVNQQGRKKIMQRMGIEAEDAIDEFMNLTLLYEQKQTPSLQGFVAWFENDETAIKREGDDVQNDAVRLMTVHHSKGLQARVVFLPDSVQLPQNKKEQMLLFNEDNLVFYPLCSDDYDDFCKQINKENAVNMMEEYRRLLYVALTRAEEQLIVCGYANSEAIKDDSWLKICERTIGENSIKEQDISVIETPELVKIKPQEKYFASQEMQTAEPWIDVDAQEETPLSKPYTPSKLPEDDEEEPDSSSPLNEETNYYRRGTLIHKILQFLPADSSDKENIIDEYMNKNATDFSITMRAQIKKEILNLLAKEEYAILFGPDSRAEVPVFGEVDGKIISAQIDRLVVLKDKVIIVDFKTNRPAKKTLDETPEVYKSQLRTYEALIRKVFPEHKVESYILWTNEARLMRIS